MSLTSYLDKGASLGADAACLTMGEATLSYGEAQELSWLVAKALADSGVRPGDKVAILSANDPVAFCCVFGIARAGAVWCPVNPRNEAAENTELLDLFDCSCLIFQGSFEPLVAQMLPGLPKLSTLVCLDQASDPAVSSRAVSFDAWLSGEGKRPSSAGAGSGVIGAVGVPVTPPGDPGDPVDPVDPAAPVAQPGDIALIVGTGGTTGRPKGVMLTGRNIETMSALTLMGYPFPERPRYLALAPLTHAAGVLCFPIMAMGGEIVVMPKPDLTAYLALIERHRITHTFLPPTLIYMLLGHEDLDRTDLSSLQCLWYGAAPMSAARLEEAIERIGPVMAQLFGQSEAPMMISMMAPADHFHPDGSIARERLSSAGRPAPLVTVAIMDDAGRLLPPGSRGEIVVRSSLVMAGYYKNPAATREASAHGWHHTGDIGYVDGDNFLYIVDRAKDMIITGGFNVYSAEVEQALMEHPAVRDCAVVGLPDEKWGERVTAVLQLQPGEAAEPGTLKEFVKGRLGSVKAPKQIEIWPDLPRSKLGKVLKTEIKTELLAGGQLGE